MFVKIVSLIDKLCEKHNIGIFTLNAIFLKIQHLIVFAVTGRIPSTFSILFFVVMFNVGKLLDNRTR